MVRASAAAAAPSSQQSLSHWMSKGKLVQKGQSTDAMLKRLKLLQTQLSSMAQERANIKELDQIRKEIFQPTIMLNKDKVVRASLACCLADLLRLYAPNAPFVAGELKDLFEFFLHQLTDPKGGLSKPNGPVYSDCVYLLHSLSTVKSVALVCDVDNADKMMLDYFRGFFSLVRPETSKNIVISYADILVQLLDESVTISQSIVDTLLANFSLAVAKSNPEARALAVQVCDAAKDKLQKYVAQHFSEEIVKAAETQDETKRLELLRKSHALIIQVAKSVPALLLNVIPQLEMELLADDVVLRLIATKALGLVFAEKSAMTIAGGGAYMASQYSSTWRQWLTRSNDKVVSVRMAWLEGAHGVLVNHAALKSDICERLSSKLVDSDEKVRLAAIAVMARLDYETLIHHVDIRTVRELSDRCRDKKPAAREAALRAVARAFSLAYTEIENGNASAIKHFAWIPSAILEALYSADKSVLLRPIQSVFEEYILPLPAKVDEIDEASWAARVFHVMRLCVSKEAAQQSKFMAFFSITNLIEQRKAFLRFVEACEEFSGGAPADGNRNADKIKAKLLGVIQDLTIHWVDRAKAAGDLHMIAKCNDTRLYRNMRTAMDPSSDLRTILKSRQETLKRAEHVCNSALETLVQLLRLATFRHINTTTVPYLLQKLENPSVHYSEDLDRKNALQVFYLIAKHHPGMLVPHGNTIATSLKPGRDMFFCNASLAALSSVSARKLDSPLKTRAAVESIKEFVLNGTEEQAKYAAKLLATSTAAASSSTPSVAQSAASNAVEELCESIVRRLPKLKDVPLNAALASMSQFIKHAHEVAADVGDALVAHLVQGILMKPWQKNEMASSKDEDWNEGMWLEDADLSPDLRSRLLAVQILTKRCEVYSNDGDVIETIAQPVIKLLIQILSAGEPVALNTNLASRARLRLKAALLLLKLARHEKCEKLLLRHHNTLALVVQDESFNVRAFFLHKLMSYCSKSLLPRRFFVVPFLAVFDPEVENRDMVRNFVAKLTGQMPNETRIKHFDMGLARLIHLVAHHPDVQESVTTSSDIISASQYLDFYLGHVASERNASFLFHLANRIKTIRDAESTGHSEILYSLAELTALLIKRRAQAYGWTLTTYRAGVNLPDDIFKPLPNPEIQKQIIKKQYLSDEMVEHFSEPLKVGRHAQTANQATAPSLGAKKTSTAPRKRARPSVSAGKKNTKRVKRNKNFESDDDNEDEDEDDDDDDEGETERSETLSDDQRSVSEDEEISDGSEADGGRGQRTREKRKREIKARNLDRQRRRLARQAA
ncbi:hypothetical protein FA10DRAFT_268328 [Acaromyces ingoldii]|uniref:ARM repeat-containing protein n=1 Tax=Acaromyces ingoldii TaxID=215250 RepID=A0A316YFC3_9BASI|nr:hypothetical protein FA10DRAFT_268328 [Acaromyces ingoldii]PWN88107.1 hypothetical protein FA10DRAFT_268328 [Acaromyces ingoldii]